MLLCRRPSHSVTINKTLSHLPPSTSIQNRSFVDAKIKWVRDPYLDIVIQREKDLKPALFLKNLILSSPSLSLPISIPAAQKSNFSIPSTAFKFFRKYPSLFQVFRPSLPHPTLSPLHVKLTPEFLALHGEEIDIHESVLQRESAAMRLVKLLMLTRVCRIPLTIIDDLKFDLGLPDNYILDVVSSFPEYFRICRMTHNDESSAERTLGLELVCWRKEMSVSYIQKKVLGDDMEHKIQQPIKFPLSFPSGFDLQKKVKNWTEEWQCLPYISPYEDAFHLAPSSDQAEKWTVAVLHELLFLTVSKKMELKYIFMLGEYLGFGTRLKKALVHHPGIFYISNKIRTQTVVLREAFRKDFLLEKHPLIGMRHRYIHLMNQSKSKGKVTKRTSTTNGVLIDRFPKYREVRQMDCYNCQVMGNDEEC